MCQQTKREGHTVLKVCDKNKRYRSFVCCKYKKQTNKNLNSKKKRKKKEKGGINETCQGRLVYSKTKKKQ